MTKTVALFAEDLAHEEFIKALAYRIAKEENRLVYFDVHSARGGHGKAMQELNVFQKTLAIKHGHPPDLSIVCIDTNCKRYSQARRDVENRIQPDFKNRTIIACPDPHIERWHLADPPSFVDVIGKHPNFVSRKCERDYYKRILKRQLSKLATFRLWTE